MPFSVLSYQLLSSIAAPLKILGTWFRRHCFPSSQIAYMNLAGLLCSAAILRNFHIAMQKDLNQLRELQEDLAIIRAPYTPPLRRLIHREARAEVGSQATRLNPTDGQCNVCIEQGVNFLARLDPCGHAAMCEGCTLEWADQQIQAGLMPSCAVCRCRINGVQGIRYYWKTTYHDVIGAVDDHGELFVTKQETILLATEDMNSGNNPPDYTGNN